jgi:hypothetical protein
LSPHGQPATKNPKKKQKKTPDSQKKKKKRKKKKGKKKTTETCLIALARENGSSSRGKRSSIRRLNISDIASTLTALGATDTLGRQHVVLRAHMTTTSAGLSKDFVASTKLALVHDAQVL